MNITDKQLQSLAAYHEADCNRYHNGACMTVRCMRRGGYVSGTALVDYSIATCESHETAIILRSLASECAALASLSER